MTCVEKHSAGDMSISLPDTLAKVLTLTAVEFFNTSIINSYKSESFLSGTGNKHCFKSQRNPSRSNCWDGDHAHLSLFGTKPENSMSFLTMSEC
jgi:hypothetical protein